VVRSVSNCVLVLGLKSGRAARLTVLLGSAESMTTAVPAVVPLRALLIPMPAKRSSACFRSASCSVARRRSRFWASVSSSSLDSASSCARRALAASFSAMRCVLDFLFAAASASALAFASSAFLAFSRSTSESSAASHESRTYERCQVSHISSEH
jgi:hypothetical protein